MSNGALDRDLVRMHVVPTVRNRLDGAMQSVRFFVSTAVHFLWHSRAPAKVVHLPSDIGRQKSKRQNHSKRSLITAG